MDAPAFPIFTFAVHTGDAARSAAPSGEPLEAAGASSGEPVAEPLSRKERLLRLLLASRQMQQR